jgi:Protein tyrosine and serine/threonine kinase
VLLRKMLEKTPEDRFQTPAELQGAIEKAAQELAAECDTANECTPSPAAKRDSGLVSPPQTRLLDDYLAMKTAALVSDRYRIIGEESEGNGGRLFQALNEQSPAKETVAVKLLHPDISSDPELLDLLENELGVIRQAEHPNVVRYAQLVREGEFSFIVREWMHGVLLYDLLRWRGALKAHELLILLDPLATTLDFIANRGLGLVEVSVRKLFLVCPPATSEFESLAKGDCELWKSWLLKLNPLSLGPLLFRTRNSWNGLTVVPSSRVLSITQAGAGIRGTNPIQLYGKLIYELLSGRPPTQSDNPVSRYRPLPELDEAGNEILQRALGDPKAPYAYKTCEEYRYWRVAVIAPPRYPLPHRCPSNPPLPPKVRPLANYLSLSPRGNGARISRRARYWTK